MGTANEATSRHLVLGLVLAAVASLIGQVAKFFWILLIFFLLDLGLPVWILGFEIGHLANQFSSVVLLVPPVVAILLVLALHKEIRQESRYYLWCFGLGFFSSFILFWFYLFAQ